MAWNQIDATTPAGGSKKKFGDDAIRELKGQVINNLQEISHYPVSSALRKAVWTTATRPASGLVDRLTGYNDTIGMDEYYDLATATWMPCVKSTVVQGWIDAVIPIGMIVLWSGAVANIPAKWSLCNGANGTPDLRDKFVVGAGSTYSVGAAGGAASNTLSTANLPNHFHFSSASPSDGTKAGSNLVNEKGDGEDGFAKYAAGSGCIGDAGDLYGQIGTDVAFRTGSMTTGGTATEITNLPPYYALCYIMRTG